MVTVISVILCAVLHNVAGSNIEEIKEQYAQVLAECIQINPVTEEDLAQLRNKQMPISLSAKCLLACAYKKSNMMDDNGYLAVDEVNNISKRFFEDEIEKMKKAFAFTDACKYVNDVDVTDGDIGCERAGLIYECSIEKAPQFNFSL